MKKYFKIGELSKLYGVGADSIRYYEEIGLISPQRGENKYRMYSINDIWKMNVIRDLRPLGFSLEQIRNYLDNRSVQTTIELLGQEQQAIEEQLAHLFRQKQEVQNRRAVLEAAREKPIGVVEQAYRETRYCHEITEAYSDDPEMDVMMKRLINLDRAHLYIVGNNRIGSRMGLDVLYGAKPVRYKSVFIIDENGDSQIPAGEYIAVNYRGASGQRDGVIPALLSYAKENNLKPTGDPLEILWIDIHEAADPREHVTELQVRVETG